jgi:hypothetical protein
MWTETKSFKWNVPVGDIIDWAKDCDGKLVLTINETDAENHTFFK